MKKIVKNDIIEVLTSNGFDLTLEVDNSNYYFKGNGVLVSYVAPHKGTDWRHLIRAEVEEEFDRWSNAQYWIYVTYEMDIDEMLEDLMEMCGDTIEDDNSKKNTGAQRSERQ